MAPGLQTVQFALYYLTLGSYFLLAWVLYRRGLWSAYRFFWMGIVFEGFALGLSLATARVKGAEKIIYLSVQPVLCVLYVLMVIEVFRKVFVRYPGIARFSQRFIVVSMLVAFTLAIATAGGDMHEGATVVEQYSVALRAITTALCLYLMLIAAFLVWMPVPLAPNSIRHSFLFFFYFIGITAVHYLINIGSLPLIRIANLMITGITMAALLCWAWLLQPAGERPPSDRAIPQAGVAAILNRLESINRTLSPPEE